MSGILYLVSTPMGNPDDITLSALKVFKSVDILVCEEWKNGKALQRNYDFECELMRLNEHDRDESTPELLDLLKQGKTIALTSDCGTPVFSDPGFDLVKLCHRSDIQVTHISGASSLISALVLSGFSLERFFYMGWLPRKREERDKSLSRLQNEKHTAVIMETPYRLVQLLESIKLSLGKDRVVSVCCNLSTENEFIKRGKIGPVISFFKEKNEKHEFVVLVGGLKERL
jgi:16S rRNA (cytidine1402-2'-O)-methyltransferase